MAEGMRKNPNVTQFGVGIVGILLLLVLYFLSFPKWEYRVVKFLPEIPRERLEREAFAFTTVKVDEELVAKLGEQGWELAAAYLESETAFPNFGKSEYVTGLQPNIRPQAAVLLFKRQKYPWRK